MCAQCSPIKYFEKKKNKKKQKKKKKKKKRGYAGIYIISRSSRFLQFLNHYFSFETHLLTLLTFQRWWFWRRREGASNFAFL